ncbi:hypothetical protein C5B93_04545 [Rathayibacter sp. AY1A2]|uniref:hypothetical protein n=1 Tax=Rathayibacter sp. AY1A2 TaxID=2080520 RepID=UPI000CE8B1E5|nr:hypothetical protein [Rathayibacter sp. AY1A2]PPF39316.1 hypothetical protein C5B93_04545 [Rathayibacter sp. AY1A2]
MSHFYDVDVYRHVDEEDGGVWWNAEAGLENSSVGVEHESSQDVREILNGVHDDTIEYRRRWPDLRVRLFEGDGQPATEFRAALQAAEITLPKWVAP